MLERELGKLLKKKQLTIAAAESLTGGLFSKRITDVSGSSDYFSGSVVVYSYSAKEKILGVPKNILEKKGAVSKETAFYMAKNVSSLFHTDIGVGFTGVAGPSLQEAKPVGLVYISVFYKGDISIVEKHFSGNRREIRDKAVNEAMNLIIKIVGG